MDAIYARQSVDKKGSLSIEGQIELCRKFTAGELRIFSDRGFSGKNMRRPAFGELMEAVEAGEIERIVVYRLDRFSRSLADFSRIWEVLQKKRRCVSLCQRAVRHIVTGGTRHAEHRHDVCAA